MSVPRKSDEKKVGVIPEVNQTNTLDLDMRNMRYHNRLGHETDLSTVQPGTDIVYELKIAVRNSAILDLGMGRHQWTIALLIGFKWYIDNVCYLFVTHND